jgi:short-subunit dehydrogenase
VALPRPSASSTALVTGASAGIGAAIARELASRGHGVTLVARREERLRDLASELSANHAVRTEVLAADLGDPEARDGLVTSIEGLGLDVEIVINNAGFGDAKPLVEADRERLIEMVRLNCESLLDLQQRYLPAMVERGRGAVLNLASTAAFQPLPNNATYAATKAFVLHLSEAAHAELSGSEVSVCALCPGPVRTEFMQAAEGLETAEEQLPDVFWMSADAVAKQAIDGLDKGKRVVIPGLMNRAGAITGQHAPRALFLPAAKRLWGRVL